MIYTFIIITYCITALMPGYSGMSSKPNMSNNNLFSKTNFLTVPTLQSDFLGSWEFDFKERVQ